ncbi:hypothetical protein YC2023_107331 [Brassica napus]
MRKFPGLGHLANDHVTEINDFISVNRTFLTLLAHPLMVNTSKGKVEGLQLKIKHGKKFSTAHKNYYLILPLKVTSSEFFNKAVGGSNSDINNLDGLIGLRGGLWKREIENELDHRSLRIRIFQLRHLVSGGEICYEECRPWKHVLHVVTNLGAMQVMLKLKDYNGSHVEGILLLDDDVVVQKDLTGHWEIDMDRKVNGGCRDLCRFVPLVCSVHELLASFD